MMVAFEKKQDLIKEISSNNSKLSMLLCLSECRKIFVLVAAFQLSCATFLVSVFTVELIAVE